MKKFISFFMTVIMCFIITMNTYALEDTYTVTINFILCVQTDDETGPDEPYLYVSHGDSEKLYQIYSGVLDDNDSYIISREITVTDESLTIYLCENDGDPNFETDLLGSCKIYKDGRGLHSWEDGTYAVFFEIGDTKNGDAYYYINITIS